MGFFTPAWIRSILDLDLEVKPGLNVGLGSEVMLVLEPGVRLETVLEVGLDVALKPRLEVELGLELVLGLDPDVGLEPVLEVVIVASICVYQELLGC